MLGCTSGDVRGAGSSQNNGLANTRWRLASSVTPLFHKGLAGRKLRNGFLIETTPPVRKSVPQFAASLERESLVESI